MVKVEPGSESSKVASADAILDSLFSKIKDKVKDEPPSTDDEEDSEEDSGSGDESDEEEEDEEESRRAREEEERRRRKKKEKKERKKAKKEKKKKSKHRHRDQEGQEYDRHRSDRDDDGRRRRSDRGDDDERRRERDKRRSERSEELISRKSKPMSPPPSRDRHARGPRTPSPPPKRITRLPSPKRISRPLSPPVRGDYRDRDIVNMDSSRDKDFRREESRRRDRSKERSSSRRERSKSKERERPPTRHKEKDDGGDSFWDSKWEAKELVKEAEAQERRGRRLHDYDRKHHKEAMEKHQAKMDAKAAKEAEEAEREDESDELRRLRELREVTSLVVPEDKKYVAEKDMQDPNEFEWNDKTMMWTRKEWARRKVDKKGDGEDEEEEEEEDGEVKGDFDHELKKRMDEQAEEGKRKFIPIDKQERKTLTMDEIEEIRKKRDKHKKGDDKKKEKGEREEGEVGSDDEHEPRSKKSRRRSRSRTPQRKTRKLSRSRSRSRGRRESPSRRGFGSSRENDFYRDYRGTTRRRSRSRSRDRSRRSRSRDRSRRGRGRSRSRDRSRDRNDGGFRSSRAEIDKAKLLAIARKNAVKLLNSDNLMGMDHDRLMQIKSGGQSLGQLTSFCRELARKGITDEFSDDDEIINRPVGSDDERDDGPINHPFAVTDRAIPNPFLRGGESMRPAIELDSLTPQARLAARSHRMIEFPVSSGSSHRVKESSPEPEPVVAPGDQPALAIMPSAATQNRLALMPPPAAPAPLIGPVQPSASAVPVVEAKNEVDPMPDDDDLVLQAEIAAAEAEVAKANYSNPLGQIMFGGAVNTMAVDKSLLGEGVKQEEELPQIDESKWVGTVAAFTPAPKPKAVAPAPSTTGGFVDPMLPGMATNTMTTTVSAQFKDKVFEAIEAPTKDLSSIVSNRLAAMKKLSENPNDPEALRDMYEAQRMMSTWAESKNKPGQFTGHTGAKVLTQAELSLGVQAWAKQDQFDKAPKVQGGFGEFLLKKMGWSEGDGLGKNRNGEVNPLTLDIKQDKRGLIASDEAVGKKGRAALQMTAVDLSGKHPVSALMELAVKRRWGVPTFSEAFACGPRMMKQFIYKVTVNGTDYQPTLACDNKKKAKADAATVALQQLGMLPIDPNNPL